MNLKKHAFLVMAHSNLPQLRTLLSLLDHERVDIFLHVDRKAPFSPEEVLGRNDKSKIFLLPQRSIHWGGQSQIRCELDLMEKATPGKYTYYHLLSGLDLPLKPMDQILAFFDENAGKEFVHFDGKEMEKETKERFSLYWLFQEWERSGGLFYRANHALSHLQLRLGVDRTRGEGKRFKGANWFSCTHALVSSLVKEKRKILRRYRFTRCCDEVFLQTFLMEKGWEGALFDTTFSDSPRANMRFVDWERGNPFVFGEKDVPELVRSEYLFARKFDEKTDPRAIDLICQHLKKCEKDENEP